MWIWIAYASERRRKKYIHQYTEFGSSKGLAEFKRASNDIRRNLDEEARAAEEKERIARESAAKEALEPEKVHEAAASKVCAWDP